MTIILDELVNGWLVKIYDNGIPVNEYCETKRDALITIQNYVDRRLNTELKLLER